MKRPSVVSVLNIAAMLGLAKAGIPRAPWEGPQDFADRVARERPEHAAAVRAAAEAYAAARYGPPDPQALALLAAATRWQAH